MHPLARLLYVLPVCLGAAARAGDVLPVVTGQGFFPVICKLKDGRLGVVLRGGAPHVGISGRLDFVASADGGRTWSRPFTVADGPADDRNPAFGQTADGTLLCLYHVQQNYNEKGQYEASLGRPMPIFAVRSSDGGKTWGRPSPVDCRPLKWGSPYGKILTLPDGSLLVNIYGRYPEPLGGATGHQPSSHDCTCLFRSMDHGTSWAFLSRMAVGYNETAIALLPNGRLLGALRTDASGISAAVAVAYSDNGGHTWADPKIVTRPNQHPADLLVLSNDRVLLTYGHRLSPQGVRGILSADGGRTFPSDREFVVCDDATSFDCGYPSSALLDDGRIVTVYYSVTSTKHPDWGTHCAAVMYGLPK
ncbi:MAG: exo-alpha-sialidase [Phycisphaerae bacterium]|nr:exo-alpha-sialidase [Phycisphaerae bacterium]